MPLESSISETVDGFYELNLEGRIHRPLWVVQLFAALLQLRVSIISGHATQDKRGEWKSRFILDFSKSSFDPKHLDYSGFSEKNSNLDRTITLSLKKIKGSPESMSPKLSSFELKRRPDQQLEVSLKGPDQIGFLASILGKFSGLALFPSSLKIDTVKGEIADCLVLRGIGDRGPSDAAYQSLERMLRSFVI